MLQIDRFIAAENVYMKMVDTFKDLKEVEAINLEEASLNSKRNPGGPEFVIYATNLKRLKAKQKEGKLPRKIKSSMDSIRISLRKSNIVFNSADAHTGDENPIKPGASISDSRISSGTMGAVVDSPGNGDHFITAGHVLIKGKDVYQAGRWDARLNRTRDRVVGAMIENSFLKKTSDGALVKVKKDYKLDRIPHDSPAPSPSTPAVGIYSASDEKDDGWCFYGHINRTLKDLKASMNNTAEITAKDIGERVYASGKASGEIVSQILGLSTLTGNGSTIYGFHCTKIKGAKSGDSGAVAIIQNGVAIKVNETGPLLDISVVDADNSKEYLPGNIPELEAFIKDNGSNVRIKGQTVKKGDGKSLIARIVARLRKLGELEINVQADGYENACVEGRVSRYPNNCEVVILRKDKETPARKKTSFPEDQADGEESKSVCRTFGKLPYVRVSGDDFEETKFGLDITGTGSINILFRIEQKVTQATFYRFGSCHKGICSKEELRGSVDVSRTITFEISGGVGDVELPGIGKISAGGASFKRTTSKSVTKKFVIPCGV
ncbi:MAG: hypothetical protein EP338_01605 [Bacteroidetes bacterium]|nr:MAG: hypothetical protein EP338_01605 [Bacteroidota bacterium]